MADEGHDYDYVTSTPQPRDNEYEANNRTPFPALTNRAVLSPNATDYEVPLQSLAGRNRFDQPPNNSPQYEVVLSAPSVKLEIGKVCLLTIFPISALYNTQNSYHYSMYYAGHSFRE